MKNSLFPVLKIMITHLASVIASNPTIISGSTYSVSLKSLFKSNALVIGLAYVS